jgi:hypothetical protein
MIAVSHHLSLEPAKPEANNNLLQQFLPLRYASIVSATRQSNSPIHESPTSFSLDDPRQSRAPVLPDTSPLHLIPNKTGYNVSAILEDCFHRVG